MAIRYADAACLFNPSPCNTYKPRLISPLATLGFREPKPNLGEGAQGDRDELEGGQRPQTTLNDCSRVNGGKSSPNYPHNQHYFINLSYEYSCSMDINDAFSEKFIAYIMILSYGCYT